MPPVKPGARRNRVTIIAHGDGVSQLPAASTRLG